MSPVLLFTLFVFLLLFPFAFVTHLGVQVTKIIPIPRILILLSPPPVSQIAMLKDNLDLPLMWAVGIVRDVGVYPNNLVVEGNLVPVPSYKESQAAAGL